jgi:hypothetical protein
LPAPPVIVSFSPLPESVSAPAVPIKTSLR